MCDSGATWPGNAPLERTPAARARDTKRLLPNMQKINKQIKQTNKKTHNRKCVEVSGPRFMFSAQKSTRRTEMADFDREQEQDALT